jgi:transforming growth factor-beta-induced protein
MAGGSAASTTNTRFRPARLAEVAPQQWIDISYAYVAIEKVSIKPIRTKNGSEHITFNGQSAKLRKGIMYTTTRNARNIRKASGLVLSAALFIGAAGIAGNVTPASAAAKKKATTPVATESDAAKAGVPKTGKGSLKGMAQDPAATAASNNPQLSTLVAAVKAAGLVDTLNGAGPFTIFAPANSAFAKLPAGTVDTLVKPENKATLTSILTYHVIAGKKLSSADLVKGKSFATVNGESVTISGSGKNLTVNGSAKVVLADVQVANGTVFIIDSVLMPAKPAASAPTTAPASASPIAAEADAAAVGVPATGKGSLAGMAQDPAATAASNNPQLTTLVAAVKAAGLVDTLNGAGPFTIFAPVNSAFDKLPAGTVETLVKPENKAKLTSILTYHVIAGKKLSSKDLATMTELTTVNGKKLTVSVSGKTVTINGSVKSVLADVQVANGTVFLIDSVLIPE